MQTFTEYGNPLKCVNVYDGQFHGYQRALLRKE